MRSLSMTSPLRERRIADVNRAYERRLAQGFSVGSFEGQPEAETLQCRNELDRTNWLGLVVKCQFAIAQGYGDVLEAGTRLRCSSNRMYQVTPNDALGRMAVLLGAADAAQQHWWDLKDQCRTATSREALEAIEIDEGWP